MVAVTTWTSKPKFQVGSKDAFSLLTPIPYLLDLNHKSYEKQGILENSDSVRHLDTDSSIDCDGNNQLHGARTHLLVTVDR